jgi:transcription antitermination factor NusG
MVATQSPWVVVRSKPKQEHLAKLHLQRAGCRVLLPLFKPSPADPIKVLFPSYLFCQLNEVGQWWFIKSTVGCLAPLMGFDGPKKMPDRVIAQFIEMTDEQGLLHHQAPQLTIGQPVKIKGGSFINQIGELLSLDNHERANILLELLGQSIPVSIPVGYLEPVISV